MVTYADLGSKLNLNAMAIAFLENTEYEPEQFPGLFYRLDDPRAVILAFSLRRIVIAGCKTWEDAERQLRSFVMSSQLLVFL